MNRATSSSETLIPTNGASSGIEIDRKTLKFLMRRNDIDGLKWVGAWIVGLAFTGYGVYLSMGTPWIFPAMFLYGSLLTLSGYALSHETSHGTVFRTRWMNELFFFISSFIYLEEPYYRRYAHASHHTYTYHKELDSQIPYKSPMTLYGWIKELTGVGFLIYAGKAAVRNATGQFADSFVRYTPESELPKIKWNSRFFLALYVAMGVAIYFGADFLLWYFVIPRLAGGPLLSLYSILQHVEMDEEQMDLRNSTRSFTTNWFSRLIYMNMNYHLEHHMYPTVPFHALPALNEKIKDQLPEPDPGFFRTSWWAFKTVFFRSMGQVPMKNLARSVPVR